MPKYFLGEYEAAEIRYIVYEDGRKAVIINNLRFFPDTLRQIADDVEDTEADDV